MNDARRNAPATARNRDPILAILRRVLPANGTVLEIASGTGEHAVYFAANLPALTWQPSDADRAQLASIGAWAMETAVTNVSSPIQLDVTAPEWPIASADAIVAINMIHIAPWAACEGLMRGAARLLASGSPLFLYGPYKLGGAHTSPSNEAFDESLRARDPAWGVRDLERVEAVAAAAGFTRVETIAMPANNLSVVFRRD